MKFEYLYTPVSDEEPCGPDLEEAGDEAFEDYVFGADDRLPANYYDQSKRALFDRTSINLAEETEEIAALLSRTRDVRLLTLEARFQILAGNIPQFCDCIEALAHLLEQFWPHIHPGSDGDFDYRRSALEALESQPSCIRPLMYAPIIHDRRFGTVTYRQYALANGMAEPYDGEDVVDAVGISNALANLDHIEDLEKTYKALKGCIANLSSIRTTFMNEGEFNNTPSFQALIDTINEILEFLAKCQPSLAGDVNATQGEEGEGSAEQDETGEENAGTDAAQAGETAATFVNGSAAPSILPGQIASHATAKKALEAVENYFVQKEPSAPALILVQQARQLTGRPLVDALEVLIPAFADDARIQLGSNDQLKISMNRMRTLSENAIENGWNGSDEADDSGDFEVHTRDDAIKVFVKLEGFFKTVEPSSPIPILLQKARTYLNKDFASIIGDLIA